MKKKAWITCTNRKAPKAFGEYWTKKPPSYYDRQYIVEIEINYKIPNKRNI